MANMLFANNCNTTIKTATLASLSLSGLAVQITQVSGGTQGNCAYTAIRLF